MYQEHIFLPVNVFYGTINLDSAIREVTECYRDIYLSLTCIPLQIFIPARVIIFVDISLSAEHFTLQR